MLIINDGEKSKVIDEVVSIGTPIYDVLIKAHSLDYFKLPFVIESLKYLSPQPENVYILSPDGYKPENTAYESKLICVRDDAATPYINRDRILHRKNWCWSTLMAMMQDFTENNFYLDVQCDNFFTAPVEVFQNGKPVLFKTEANYHNHEPYHRFADRVYGLKRLSVGTYIIEFVLYNKSIRNKLFERFSSHEEMIEKVYNTIDNNCYPSDQDINANLILNYFIDDYVHVLNVNSALNAKDYTIGWTVEEIKENIRAAEEKGLISVSCHTSKFGID